MATQVITESDRIDQPQLVEAFQQLVLLAKTTRSDGWQFKAKYYKQVGDLIKALSPEQYAQMYQTTDFLIYFQENGMKFRGELDYYVKCGEWKSRVLDKLDQLLQTGSVEVITKQSPEIWAEVKAVRELTQIPELGESKAKSLFSQGFREAVGHRKMYQPWKG